METEYNPLHDITNMIALELEANYNTLESNVLTEEDAQILRVLGVLGTTMNIFPMEMSLNRRVGKSSKVSMSKRAYYTLRKLTL